MKKTIGLILVLLLLPSCLRRVPSPVNPLPTSTLSPAATPTLAPPPTLPAPTATLLPPSPTPEPTAAAPTLPTQPIQPIYLSARVGLDDANPYWLTFDSNLWTQEPNPQSDFAQTLTHKHLKGCQLVQELGHGAPTSWAAKEYDETLGATTFAVQRWTVAATGEWVLVSYFWNDWTQQLMVKPGEDPALCMDAARTVITISEGMGFASNQRP